MALEFSQVVSLFGGDFETVGDHFRAVPILYARNEVQVRLLAVKGRHQSFDLGASVLGDVAVLVARVILHQRKLRQEALEVRLFLRNLRVQLLDVHLLSKLLSPR